MTVPAATSHARDAVTEVRTPGPAPGTSDAGQRGRPWYHSASGILSWSFPQVVPVPQVALGQMEADEAPA